jgi:hypothetical protein
MQDMSVDSARAGIISSARSLTSVISSGIGWEDDGRIEKSEPCWILQQLDHAFEQTTGAAAVDAAMVEA